MVPSQIADKLVILGYVLFWCLDSGTSFCDLREVYYYLWKTDKPASGSYFRRLNIYFIPKFLHCITILCAFYQNRSGKVDKTICILNWFKMSNY